MQDVSSGAGGEPGCLTRSSLPSCRGLCRVAVKVLEKKYVGGLLEGLFALRVQHEFDIMQHLGRSLNVASLYGAFEVLWPSSSSLPAMALPPFSFRPGTLAAVVLPPVSFRPAVQMPLHVSSRLSLFPAATLLPSSSSSLPSPVPPIVDSLVMRTPLLRPRSGHPGVWIWKHFLRHSSRYRGPTSS